MSRPRTAEDRRDSKNPGTAKRRRLPDNEAMSVARMLRVSPQKLNLIAAMIRGRKASLALADLHFSRKRAALDVRKCLEAAIANAENNHDLDVDMLVVAEAHVGGGPSLKRFQPHGRGRSGAMKKSFAHLTIVVRDAGTEPSLQKPEKDHDSRWTILQHDLAALASTLEKRSDLDDARTDVRELLAENSEARRSPGRKHLDDLAHEAAARAIPILVCGSDEEKIAAHRLIATALPIFRKNTDVADYLASKRVPCVTEIVSDAIPESRIGVGPIRVRIGVSRMIRVGMIYPDNVKAANLLAKLHASEKRLEFTVRVGAGNAKVAPNADLPIPLRKDTPHAFEEFVITPSKAGRLSIVIDYLLDGGRFSRRVLHFHCS